MPFSRQEGVPPFTGEPIPPLSEGSPPLYLPLSQFPGGAKIFCGLGMLGV